VLVSLGLLVLLCIFFFLGLSIGSTGWDLLETLQGLVALDSEENPSVTQTIIWQIRLPRVLLATLVGGTLGLGGLVFQALLRNPLAEPYILGISGGSAVGAIVGIMLGLAIFPGVAGLAFLGSLVTLLVVLLIASGRKLFQENSLLLAGVMVNAFCSAIIMFLISMTHSAKLQNVLFWLMGDLSNTTLEQTLVLICILLPCFGFVFLLARPMNILQLGRETALSLGVHVSGVTLSLLVVTSLIVSAIVCLSGLVGFVGLVIPHILRLVFGSDHRVLVPACVFGGGVFMVGCDLLARTLPSQGELPVGVVTAMIGAPLFIFLLCRSKT
jgi:iron complex transport system permease protein